MKTIPEFLNTVQLDTKAHASINYARARCAIEAAFTKRAERRAAKMAVVEAFNGSVVHPENHAPNYVLFPDQTKAKF